MSLTSVVIAIVAHSYGWVPADQAPPGGKSIGWLECEKAVTQGKEVLAFLLDEKCEWPERFRDDHRIAEAMEKGTESPQILKEVEADIAALQKFKTWLSQRGIRASFASPDQTEGQCFGLAPVMARASSNINEINSAPEEARSFNVLEVASRSDGLDRRSWSRIGIRKSSSIPYR